MKSSNLSADVLLRPLSILAGFFCSVSALAEPVVITDTFHYLDNRSVNSVGIGSGVRQQVGASSAIPSKGTQAAAFQDGVRLNLGFQPFTVAPDFFSGSRPAEDLPDGAWTIFFLNNGDLTSATTPDIFGANVIPHPTSVAISGSGVSPVFSWVNPAGSNIDAIRLNIRDNDVTVGNTTVSDVIFSRDFGPETTSFAIASAGLNLQFNRNYSLEISLLDLRTAGGFGSSNILSRTRSFFDFQLIQTSTIPQVFLPMVSLDGTVPVFSFNVEVSENQLIFVDPVVAVGYDYQIGDADPLFRSVVLPEGIGDGLYDIYLWDGINWISFSTGVAGGEEIIFGSVGVDRFRVLGIETSAGFDPSDGTAFITGLTFAGNGQFTGTMTPVLLAIPEPETLVLLAVGFALLRRARCSHPQSRVV